MRLSIFAVKDRQIGAFMTPFFLSSVGQAIRSFSDEVNRESADNIMYRHPQDFDLYELGVFESDSGEFTLLKAPDLRIAGSSCFVADASAKPTRSVGLKSA